MQRKPLIVLILMNFVLISQTTDFSCGRNTVPVTSGCVDFCPPTCNEPVPKICPAICQLNGCNCQKGYIRSENKTSPCIPKSKCPKPCDIKTSTDECGPHEVPTNCSTTCEPACNNPKPISCPAKKCETPGCLCAEGYIRRESQRKSPCILISQCPCTDCQ